MRPLAPHAPGLQPCLRRMMVRVTSHSEAPLPERGLRFRNLNLGVSVHWHVTRLSAPTRGPWLRPCARPLSTAPAWSFHGRVCCRQAQSPGAAAAAGPGHPAAARNFAQDGRIHGALSGHAGCHWQWRSRGLRAAPGGRGAGLRLGAFGMWLRRQGLAASTVPSAPDSASPLHAPLQAGFSARQSHGGDRSTQR